MRSKNTKVYEHGPSFVMSIAMWPGRFGFCCALFLCASLLIRELPSTQFFVEDQFFPASVCLKELKMFPCPMRLFCIGTRFVQPFWLQIFVVKVET